MVSTLSALDRCDFARAGWPQEVHGLPSFDELELSKRHDAIAVEARLEAEVVTGQRLDRTEPRGLQLLKPLKTANRVHRLR